MAISANNANDTEKASVLLERLYHKEDDALAAQGGFYLGQINEHHGQVGAAAALYQEIIEDFSPMEEYRAEAILALGDLQMAQGDYDAARATFRQPVSLADWPQEKPLLQIIRSYLREDNLDEAQARLERLMENYGTTASAREGRYLLAELNSEKGDYQKARELLEQVARAEMTPAEQYLLGKVSFEMGDYQTASAVLTSVAAGGAEYAEAAAYWLGSVYLAAANFSEAEEALLAYQRNYPEGMFLPEVWCTLGELNLKVSRPQEAQTSFARISGQHPRALQERAAYGIAKAVYDEERYSDAITSLLAYLTQFPDGRFRPEVYFFLAGAHFQLENYDKTGEYCDIILSRFRASRMADDAFLLKGKALYYQKKNESAISAFNEMIVRFPRSNLLPHARFYLAKANFRADLVDDALTLINDLKELPNLSFPDRLAYLHGLILYKTSRNAAALTEFQVAATSNSEDVRRAAFFKEGQCLHNLHRYQEVIDALQLALREGAEGEEAGRIRFLLGKTYYKLDRYSEASNSLQLATELLPETDLGEAWFWVADVRLRMNDFAGIVLAINSYLELPEVPYRQEALYKKADALFNLEEYTAAVIVYDELIAAAQAGNHLADYAHEAKGQCFFKMDNYELAMEEWRALENSSIPGLAQNARFNMAMYLYEQGDLAAAAERFSVLRELYPEHPKTDHVIFYQGEIAFALGDAENAVARFDELMELFPETSFRRRARYRLAEASLHMGDYPRARDGFREVLATGGDNLTGAHLGLAVALYHIGELREARDHLQPVIATGQAGLVEQALYYTALCWFEEKEYGEASAVAASLIHGYSGSSWSKLGLGILVHSLYEEGKDEELLTQRDWLSAAAEGEAGVEVLVLLAEVEERSGEPTRAIAWLRQAREQATGTLRSSIILKLAQQEYRNGDYTSALADAGEATGLPVELDEERQYLIVRAAYHLEDDAAALAATESYREGFSEGTYKLEVEYLRGLILSRQDDEVSAARELKRILDEEEPPDALRGKILLALGRSYLHQRKLIQARRRLEAALAINETDLLGEIEAELGALALAEKKYPEARQHLQTALDNNVSDQAAVQYRYGVVQFHSENYDDAKTWLGRIEPDAVVRLDAKAEYHYMLGMIAAQEKEWQTAADNLALVVGQEGTPESLVFSARYTRGEALAQLGHDAAAREEWRAVVDAARDVLAIEAQLAIAENLLVNDDFGAARAAFSYVLFNFDNNPEYMDDALFGMARADRALGDQEQMRKDIAELLRDYPDGDRADAARQLQEGIE